MPWRKTHVKGKGKWKKEVFLQAGKWEDFTQRGREFWTLKDQGRAGTKARRQRSRTEGARHHGSIGHIEVKWGIVDSRLVALEWEYLSEQLGKLYQISERCNVHSWLKTLDGLWDFVCTLNNHHTTSQESTRPKNISYCHLIHVGAQVTRVLSVLWMVIWHWLMTWSLESQRELQMKIEIKT